MNTERRTTRSENRQQALQLQLQACMQRAPFRSMVIADESGLLLAGHGDSCEDQDWLAAMSPTVHGLTDEQAATSSSERAELLVHAFEVHGERLYVGALGPRAGHTLGELLVATRGARRILS